MALVEKKTEPSYYIGYLILKKFKDLNVEKISIYDLYDILKKEGILSNRQLIIALLFLYSLDLIEFEEAYVWIKK